MSSSVTYRCPNTGEFVPIGIVTSEATITMRDCRLDCCDEPHSFTERDLYLGFPRRRFFRHVDPPKLHPTQHPSNKTEGP